MAKNSMTIGLKVAATSPPPTGGSLPFPGMAIATLLQELSTG